MFKCAWKMMHSTWMTAYMLIYLFKETNLRRITQTACEAIKLLSLVSFWISKCIDDCGRRRCFLSHYFLKSIFRLWKTSRGLKVQSQWLTRSFEVFASSYLFAFLISSVNGTTLRPLQIESHLLIQFTNVF